MSATLSGLLPYFGSKREMAPQIVSHFGKHDHSHGVENMNEVHHKPVEFKPAVGFPGYRVGDDGSVWSCWGKQFKGFRGSKSVLTEKWKVLSPNINPRSGRRIVHLKRDGKRFAKSISQLVLEAFVGPKPIKMEACHENGDCTDDKLTNLRWDTRRGNMADKVRHGTHNRGTRHNCVKLTEDQVRAIRQRVAAGESRSVVAASYGTGKTNVDCIVRGKTWKHLV